MSTPLKVLHTVGCLKTWDLAVNVWYNETWVYAAFTLAKLFCKTDNGIEMRPETSSKDWLSTGPYQLPRIQRIVVPVATAKVMMSPAAPKQKTKQKLSHVIAIYVGWTQTAMGQIY